MSDAGVEAGLVYGRWVVALDALAAGVAAAAVFEAGDLALGSSLLLGGFLAAVGAGLGRLLGDIEAQSGRSGDAPHRLIAARVAPAYVFLLVYAALLFPEPFLARSLYPLGFLTAPLVAGSTSPRVRALTDLNAGLLVAAACTLAHAPALPLAAAWLALHALSLAMRRMQDRHDALREEREAPLGPPLLFGGLAAALLVGVFAIASFATVPPVPLRVGLDPAALAAARERLPKAAFPTRALVALLAFMALAALALYAWHRWGSRTGKLPVPRTPREGDLSLGAPGDLPADTDAALERLAGTRGAVVDAYRDVERHLAARDLGRAPSEGASEHAAHLGERYPPAAPALATLAATFAAARYGPADPPAAAASQARKAGQEALARIDDG